MRRIFKKLLGIDETSHKIALGFALGVFTGITPYWGFHTVLALLLAFTFRSSPLAAALGVHVGNPLTAPVIFGATYWLGGKFVTSDPICFVWRDFSFHAAIDLLLDAPHLLLVLSVGSAIMGLPLAVVAYLLVKRGAKTYKARIRREKEKPPVSPGC